MKAQSVDEYILNAPKDVQDKLEEMRKVIKSVAKDAEEKISYGMPFYEYKGRLVYFANFKNHIGLYIPPPIIEEHKGELKKYVTSISAVQFPLHEKLPVTLIKKLVKARMRFNEERDRKVV